MTKSELIEALMPYDDEMEVMVLSVDPSCVHSVNRARYGMDSEGEGFLVLEPNAPKITLRRSM